jgi:outer membrane biosynthesis protein TonB
MATAFNESNMKLMATALFFEYTVYAIFNVYDTIKKDHPEYVFVNEEAVKLAAQNKPPPKKKEPKKKDDKKADKKGKDKKEDKKEDKKGKENVKEDDEAQHDGGDNERHDK